MSKMKVIRPFGPKDLRVVEAPIPEPGPGHVRVKVRASGICGSDKWVWSSGPEGGVAGHEVAGEIDKLGAGVHSFSIGERVMINNVGGCGTCPACRAGAFVLCPNWTGALDVSNGFGEYVIAPVRNCMALLSGIDYVDGALIMDNWGTPYGGIVRADIKQGTDVIVNGCGPIGQAAVELCKALGAYVIAVDPNKWRREYALKNGVHIALAPEELPEIPRSLTENLGVDVVLECSGYGPSYDNCLKSLKHEGTLVAIGEHAEVSFNSSDQIVRRSLKIIGSWYSTMPQGAELMQLALSGRINLKSFVTHTISLEEVPEMFGKIMDCEEGMLKCMIVFE